MLGPAIVVAQAAEFGTGKMHRDVVGRVGQRSAEMAGLGVVAEQHQRHAGHEADVFQTLAVVGQVSGSTGESRVCALTAKVNPSGCTLESAKL